MRSARDGPEDRQALRRDAQAAFTEDLARVGAHIWTLSEIGTSRRAVDERPLTAHHACVMFAA